MRFKIPFAVSTAAFLLLAGCSKPASPPMSQASPMMPPMMGQMPAGHPAPMVPMPMMTENPRSITSVEGEIQSMSDNELIVFTKKNVTLKFARDKNTVISPSGKTLLPGMRVKIDIQQVPAGMRAKEVEIIS